MADQLSAVTREDALAFADEAFRNRDLTFSHRDVVDMVGALGTFLSRHRLASVSSASAEGRVTLPPDIAAHVLSLGRVEWGQTHAHDAEGHGEHVARSVRITAAHFGQTGDQHMHGLWLAGTETVLCHTGTSPNAPKTTQALVGAWNWLVDQATASPKPVPATNQAGEVERNLEAQRRTIEACGNVVKSILDQYAARVRETNGEHHEDADAVAVAAKIETAVRALRPNLAFATQPATSQEGEDDYAAVLIRAAGQDELAAGIHRTAVADGLTDDVSAAEWCEKKAKAFRAAAAMLAATPTPPTLSEDLREAIASELPRVWTDFLDANPDDLTSPEDMPDHAYMTGQQFEDWALEAFDRAALALAQVKAS